MAGLVGSTATQTPVVNPATFALTQICASPSGQSLSSVHEVAETFVGVVTADDVVDATVFVIGDDGDDDEDVSVSMFDAVADDEAPVSEVEDGAANDPVLEGSAPPLLAIVPVPTVPEDVVPTAAKPGPTPAPTADVVVDLSAVKIVGFPLGPGEIIVVVGSPLAPVEMTSTTVMGVVAEPGTMTVIVLGPVAAKGMICEAGCMIVVGIPSVPEVIVVTG